MDGGGSYKLGVRDDWRSNGTGGGGYEVLSSRTDQMGMVTITVLSVMIVLTHLLPSSHPCLKVS